jgi:hypothetical protein
MIQKLVRPRGTAGLNRDGVGQRDLGVQRLGVRPDLSERPAAVQKSPILVKRPCVDRFAVLTYPLVLRSTRAVSGASVVLPETEVPNASS